VNSTYRKLLYGLQAGALIACFVIGGCKTPPLTSSALLPSATSGDGILLNQINPKAYDDPDWFADSQQERKALRSRYTGELSPELSIYLENDTYIYEDQKIAAYVLKIIARLLQGWEGPKPQITIILESRKFFNAYVDEYHQLHIHTGVLRSVTNEDQLAALLAHELSHILLRHNSDKKVLQKTDAAIAMTDQLMIYSGNVAGKTFRDQELQKKAEDGQVGCQSLGLIWADILMPKWSRDDEREADMMGVDLLIRANYNYEELETIIKKIHDASVARSERLELFRKLAYDRLEANHDKINTSAGTKVNSFMESLRAGMERVVVESTADSITSIGGSHEDRDERIDSYKTYLHKAYGGGELPLPSNTKSFAAVVKNPQSAARLERDLAAIESIYALLANNMSLAREKSSSLGNRSQSFISGGIARSSVELADHKYGDARKDLETLVRMDVSPVEAYIKLARLYMAQREYGQAEQTLKMGSRKIGRDYSFLPTLIANFKAAGNIAAAEESTIRCKIYDEETERSLGETLLYSLGDNGGYYQTCTEVLGYDVLAKRQKNTAAEIPNIFKDALKNLLK
jgi:predicted Zn-dependent protease